METRNKGQKKEEIKLQMTPMIDITFQLLVFFIMLFNPNIEQEGDFSINMPQASPQSAPPDQVEFPVLKLHLEGPSGNLDGINLQGEDFGNDSKAYEALNRRIIEHIGTDSGPGSNQETAQIEISFSYNLRYEYVIGAVSAVSGYQKEGGEISPLIGKIQFKPGVRGVAPTVEP